MASAYGVRAYSDYRAMLQQEALDAVSVAVPTRFHGDVARSVIERGLDLIIEKPLSSSVQEREEIVALAHRANVKLTVGHVERCNPAIIELKSQLDQGRLGTIYRIHASRVGPFTARIRDVGVAMDLATHDLDIMLHLTGSKVERAYAEIREGVSTEHEDLFTGLLRFTNGTVGTVDVNWLSPRKERCLSVLGERGMFKLDYQGQTLDFYPTHPGLGTMGLLMQNPEEGGIAKESLHVTRCEPLKRELEAFLDMVSNGVMPSVSGEEALAVVKLAQTLVEAGRTGEVVDFAVVESR